MEVLVNPWSKNFQVKVRLWKTGMSVDLELEWPAYIRIPRV